jgi:hypothetical protein
VLPTLPLRVRNRLASTIIAALGDEDARRQLRVLASDDATVRGWLAPEDNQLTAAVQERADRAAHALADHPALAAETDLDEALQAAGLLFDAGLHFEVHEVLEPHWIAAQGEVREALQGLIQIAVGFQHLVTGNRRGALTLLHDGAAKATAGALPDRPLTAYAGAAQRCGAALAALGDGAAFDRTLIPPFPRATTAR